jgi:hypothetical protein
MATIGHWQSLVNQSKTIQHLWTTSRHLLEEVDRQWHEAWVVFTQIKWMGLQQELYGSHFTASLVRGRSEQSTSLLSSQPSYYPPSSPPTQFHCCEETVINDNLSSYHESEDPLAFLLSLPPLPLGTIGNPIIVSDDKDDINSPLSSPSYREVWSTFTTPTLQLLHCQDCTNRCHYYFDCPQYICDHCLMHAPHHCESDCLNRWSRWYACRSLRGVQCTKTKFITRAECDWDVAALEDNCWGARCVIWVFTTHRNLHKSFKSRDMERGWYWLLWSTGGVEVEGFLSESQGLLRWIAIKDEVEVENTKSQWRTESKVAKVANILRLNWYWLHKIWRENEFFILSEHLHKSFN